MHNKLLISLGEKYNKIILSQSNRPEGMSYFDKAVHESHGGGAREIVDVRHQGAKMIGTFCISVPDEIILAVSAIPDSRAPALHLKSTTSVPVPRKGCL